MRRAHHAECKWSAGFQPAGQQDAGAPFSEEEHLMNSERKPRILIAKPGLDGHDRGAKIIARALRDAGMEVIYTGLRQTPQMVVEAALQEDVDAIGLSILSGAHMSLVPRIMELLQAEGMTDVPVFLGGIVPDQDVSLLIEMGVAGIFGPGASIEEITTFIWEKIRGERTV
jgi:methylmalonyl-CoA mutase C-terminal domain/subunit